MAASGLVAALQSLAPPHRIPAGTGRSAVFCSAGLKAALCLEPSNWAATCTVYPSNFVFATFRR
jgi:hypothetical protein